MFDPIIFHNELGSRKFVECWLSHELGPWLLDLEREKDNHDCFQCNFLWCIKHQNFVLHWYKFINSAVLHLCMYLCAVVIFHNCWPWTKNLVITAPAGVLAPEDAVTTITTHTDIFLKVWFIKILNKYIFTEQTFFIEAEQDPGPLFTKMTLSYRYMSSHYKPEMVVRPS